MWIIIIEMRNIGRYLSNTSRELFFDDSDTRAKPVNHRRKPDISLREKYYTYILRLTKRGIDLTNDVFENVHRFKNIPIIVSLEEEKLLTRL